MKEDLGKIPADSLQLGDEVELWKEDPIEPLLRMPNHPAQWWTVSELMEGGYLTVPGIGNIDHKEPTVIAVLIRDVTAETLALDAEHFRCMLFSMGLSGDSKSFRITKRSRFIKHHRVRVVREVSSKSLEQIRYSA